MFQPQALVVNLLLVSCQWYRYVPIEFDREVTAQQYYILHLSHSLDSHVYKYVAIDHAQLCTGKLSGTSMKPNLLAHSISICWYPSLLQSTPTFECQRHGIL